MSFNDTKTPSKADVDKRKQKYFLPLCRTNGTSKFLLEGENREQFIRLFPKNSNRRIMQWFGISHATMQRFKRELGLKKDMTAIRKQLAKDVKKICEKNGYYDSIRGRRPSQATIDSLVRRRKEYDPWTTLKANNPRKYKKALKKRAAKWRETYEKDIKRARWGLPQKTKFRITLYPISHTASTQKHAMIKYCNYFADPDHPSWVCYDSETKRSARREATAVKHGLRIVAGE